MKLKIKEIGLSTGGPLIAVLNEKTLKKLSIFSKDRIHIKKLRAKNGITCVINVSEKGIHENEIGLFHEAFNKLNIPEGTHIELIPEERPKSIQYIKNKLNGEELKNEEIFSIVKDIVNNELSEVELAYFVSGCYTKGLSIKETLSLTNAMVENGEQLHFKDKIICEKHCTGGVAGNRTTLVVIPILASLGYKIPNTSSRAITSVSGTSDTMEVLAPVTLSKEKIMQVIKKTNACIVWGGGVDLASADDKMITVRHPLSMDPTGMLLASILAKKKATGITHLLMDIPYGSTAKIKTKKDAKKLAKLFLKVSKHLNIKIKVLITDGSQPIGNGIGPALECEDVLSVLQGDGPNDLREKSIYLAVETLKLVGEKDPLQKVLDAIESGKAYDKLIEIIRAQGGHKHPILPKAKYFFNVNATKNGKITLIDNKKINKIAMMTGAPEDKASGLYLRVRCNREIKKGTTLFTVYSNSLQNIENIKKQLKEINPITY